MAFPPKIIETERLRLRQPRLRDAKVIFDTYASDPEVTLYLTWYAHATPADTEGYLRLAQEAWKSGKGHRPWQIEDKTDGTILGAIGTTMEGHHVEVGYVLARRYWNRGYITEAMRGVVDAAFEDERIWRVGALCDVENRASARVMEKSGLVHEGMLRGWLVHPNRSDKPRDALCYSLLRPDWEKAKAPRKRGRQPR